MRPSPNKTLTVESKYGKSITMYCFDSLPSVSALAKEFAKADFPDRTCVFSPLETDRVVKDKKGHDIPVPGMYLSLILRPSFFPQQAGFLSHLSASALATTLQSYTDKHIGIGWVSDIFAESEKIGSVDMESRLDRDSGYEYLLIHFAVAIDEKIFPVRLTDLMRQVFEESFSTQDLLIASSLLDKFFSLYVDFQNTSKFINDYRCRFVMNGLTASYTRGGRKKRCKLLGVDTETGKLRVEMPNGAIVDFSGRSGLILPEVLPKLKTKRSMEST